MYYGVPCHGYAINCHLVYLAIPGTIPLCTKKQNLFVLFICNQKSEIQNCSNKHETGLVLGIFHAFLSFADFFFHNKLFRKFIGESNGSDPDQARRIVGAYLGLNCLQISSADGTNRQIFSVMIVFCSKR